MLMQVTHRLPASNKLLAALPHPEYRRLLASLEPITLAFGEVLYEPGDVVRYVYFPNDSLISLLTLVDPPLALEVGMVGHEGMVGVSLALGVSLSPVRALVQGAGTAMRMKAAPFRKELRHSLALQRQVGLYAHELMIQIAQTAACNRFHVVEARLARWLLMTRDRVGSDHFHLTHEFIGHMLGVRRVGVTHAAHAIKQRGLIDYSRGNIDIIDGPGLEASACSCYRRAKDSYQA
ncbi:Crp/Fnr family transcriptional regulator [Thiobacillus thioparus]|uniref:Crp/Fnr family transcriptional regulator n=1 Tax=Thiobacillus thioparus TaxID=931 RepID=UPI00035D825C|nr:Crp/Fnr family transcriptional regulator [Thiobacillus thioparus]